MGSTVSSSDVQACSFTINVSAPDAGHTVYLQSSGDGTNWNDVTGGSSSYFSYPVSGASANTLYRFRAREYDPADSSSTYSAPENVKTPDIAVPNQPQAANVAECSYSVTFAGSSYPNGYVSLERYNGGSWQGESGTGSQASAYSNTSAYANTTYLYRATENACGVTKSSPTLTFKTPDIEAPNPPVQSDISACWFTITVPGSSYPNGSTWLEQSYGSGYWNQVGSSSSNTQTYGLSAYASTTYLYRTREQACGADKVSSTLTFETPDIEVPAMPSTVNLGSCSYTLSYPGTSYPNGYVTLERYNGSYWQGETGTSSQQPQPYGTSASANATYLYRTTLNACNATKSSGTLTFRTPDLEVPAPPEQTDVSAGSFTITIPGTSYPNGSTWLEQSYGSGYWNQVGSSSSSTQTLGLSAYANTTYLYRTRLQACDVTKASSTLTFKTPDIEPPADPSASASPGSYTLTYPGTSYPGGYVTLERYNGSYWEGQTGTSTPGDKTYGTSASANTTYLYRVTVNAYGATKSSDTYSFQTPDIASPSSPGATDVSACSYTITVPASPYYPDGSTWLEWGDGGNNWSQLSGSSSSTQTFGLSASANTTYIYRTGLQAYNATKFSSDTTVKTPDIEVPADPVKVSLTACSYSIAFGGTSYPSGIVTLERYDGSYWWGESGTGSQIYTYSNSGAYANTTYTYRATLMACNATKSSGTLTFMTPDITAPNPPIQSDVSACSYTLTIPGPVNPNGYVYLDSYYANGSGGGTWYEGYNSSSSTQTYGLSASANTTYTYRAREQACGATRVSSTLTFKTPDIEVPAKPSTVSLTACSYSIAFGGTPYPNGIVTLEQYDGSNWWGRSSAGSQTQTYGTSASANTTYLYRATLNACNATKSSATLSFRTLDLETPDIPTSSNVTPCAYSLTVPGAVNPDAYVTLQSSSNGASNTWYDVPGYYTAPYTFSYLAGPGTNNYYRTREDACGATAYSDPLKVVIPMCCPTDAGKTVTIKVCKVTSGWRPSGTWSDAVGSWNPTTWSPTTTNDATGSATVTPPLEGDYSDYTKLLPNGERVKKVTVFFSYQFNDSEQKHYCVIVACGPNCKKECKACSRST